MTVELDSNVLQRLKIVAARHGTTIREYVLAAVERALDAEDQQSWGRLSESTFARDWDSEADSVYDAD